MLAGGLNLASWFGPDSTPIGASLTALGDDLVVASTNDPAADRFLSYAPELPEGLNSASVLRYGQGVWLELRAHAIWARPAP